MNIIFECSECYSIEHLEPSDIRRMEHWFCPECGKDGYCFNKNTEFVKDMCLDCDGEREPVMIWVEVDDGGNEID